MTVIKYTHSCFLWSHVILCIIKLYRTLAITVTSCYLADVGVTTMYSWVKTTLVKKPSVFIKITTFRGTQSASSGGKIWSDIHVGGYGNNENDVTNYWRHRMESKANRWLKYQEACVTWNPIGGSNHICEFKKMNEFLLRYLSLWDIG